MGPVEVYTESQWRPFEIYIYIFFLKAKFLSCFWAHYFANKGPSSQGYGFSSSHVWM